MRSMVFTKNLCQAVYFSVIKKDAANNNIFWIADEYPYSMNYISTQLETYSLTNSERNVAKITLFFLL